MTRSGMNVREAKKELAMKGIKDPAITKTYAETLNNKNNKEETIQKETLMILDTPLMERNRKSPSFSHSSGASLEGHSLGEHSLGAPLGEHSSGAPMGGHSSAVSSEERSPGAPLGEHSPGAPLEEHSPGAPSEEHSPGAPSD